MIRKKRKLLLCFILLPMLILSFCSCSGHMQAGNIFHSSLSIMPVSAENSEHRYVQVGGELLGIQMQTKGITVAGTESFETENGLCHPAEDAGIREGDIILAVYDEEINSNQRFSQIIEQAAGDAIPLKIQRNNETLDCLVYPQKSLLGDKYKVGLWIRDSVAGIGTLTYLDPKTGTLAALGHGITDNDTKTVRESLSGVFSEAYVSGIIKSREGQAGQISGILSDKDLGTLAKNCDNGVYGYCNAISVDAQTLPVAHPNEIKTGEAKIICTVNGTEKQEFNIKIENINRNAQNGEKEMTIKITDKALLDLTGGIVQGMSGSPIIQNGYLVGAVTHVFVNNPTGGYAVFAETMLKESDALTVPNSNAA